MIGCAIALWCLGADKAGRERLIADLEMALLRAEATNADLREKLDRALRPRDRAEAKPSASAWQPSAVAAASDADFQKGSPRFQPPVGALRLTGLLSPELVQSETDAKRSPAVITDAPLETGRDPHSMAEIGRRALGEFRRVLSSTGLNIERLFPQLGPERAEGGPFVPPPAANQSYEISQARLEAMRSLIRSLPLAVPLQYYQLESRFGPRRDPFNRRLSFHTGIDLSAPYMAPVYATAGGVVTYAGYRSEYGKVVEIDHGNGISTLYGHLHRSIVSVGQRVVEHDQIGFLGSTGRSSGPHVHYEILVNDEPQDPEKFIELGHVIPAAER
jgi:murein DD-endopeptidase MepM/ murein hydrolase activator NlpD